LIACGIQIYLLAQPGTPGSNQYGEPGLKTDQAILASRDLTSQTAQQQQFAARYAAIATPKQPHNASYATTATNKVAYDEYDNAAPPAADTGERSSASRATASFSPFLPPIALGVLALIMAFMVITGSIPYNNRSSRALAAYQRQDYATAYQLWRPLADRGDPSAQLYIGLICQGRPTACPESQNEAEAARWFLLAAAQGFAAAQYDLGVMYATGRGVPQDNAEAIRYYRLAAAQGFAAAQYDLGVMYATGRGVPQDNAEAYKWFNLAAAQGNNDAGEIRDYLASRMTPAQIAEAQKLSRAWKRETAGSRVWRWFAW
jgi:hypothetical protein